RSTLRSSTMSPNSFSKFVCAALALFVLSVPASAQIDARKNDTGAAAPAATAPARAAAINPKYTTPKSALDTAYGAKIAEYTTEKYFMTELVDHLPLSDKVPSPEKVQ